MSLLYVLAAVAGLLALVWVFQRKLIYFPFPSRLPPAASLLAGSEDTSFVTEDGLRLGSWYLPGDVSRRTAGGVSVLVFNGNAGNRSFRAPLAQALSRLGWSVLLFDYRGYGENEGRPSEAGLLADARAARHYLAGREGTEPSRVVYFGESLGAAVAVALAAEEPPAALILRSPFTSLADVGRHHYPFLPVRLLLKDRYPSLQRIDKITAPLLVVAGEKDRIVPAAQSRTLYEAAPGPKRFVLFPDSDHNDLEMLAGPRLIQEVLQWVEEHVEP